MGRRVGAWRLGLGLRVGLGGRGRRGGLLTLLGLAGLRDRPGPRVVPSLLEDALAPLAEAPGQRLGVTDRQGRTIGTVALPDFASRARAYEDRWEKVAREDVGVLEGQQRAPGSVLFRPGPLSGRDDMVQAVSRWSVERLLRG